MTAAAMGAGPERHGRVRVLLVSQRAPDSNALGGVEIHVADLAEYVGAEIEPFGAHLRAGKLVVEQLRPTRRELALLSADDLAAALTTALATTRADVMHIHSPQLGPVALARAAGARGARMVLTLHDAVLSRRDASSLVAASDLVIAPSRFIRDLVAEAHPEVAARTRLIQWGVLPQQRVPLRSAGKLRVAIVGVHVAEKGAERLPALMGACAHLDIEWHLFGATEGRSLAAIRRAAPGVHAHGAYRRGDLGRLLGEAEIDLAMLPSIVPESFCMTLSECLSACVPSIVSNLGALAERVHDEQCGWTFDPWRPESLAATLERLVDRCEVAAVARRLESRPQRTPAAMAGEHAAIYLELAANRRSDGARAEATVAPSVATTIPGADAALRQTWRALRQSRFYRELPLRRLLPESLRARVEQRAAALLDRLRR